MKLLLRLLDRIPFWNSINFLIGILIGILLTIIFRQLFDNCAWAVNFPNIIMWVLWILITFLFINYRDSKFKERESRQAHRELQEWFHENYVLKGVDPVWAYISFLRIKNWVQDITGNPSLRDTALQREPEFPMQQINKMTTILGSKSLEKLIIDVRKAYFDPPGNATPPQETAFIARVTNRLKEIEKN